MCFAPLDDLQHIAPDAVPLPLGPAAGVGCRPLPYSQVDASSVVPLSSPGCDSMPKRSKNRGAKTVRYLIAFSNHVESIDVKVFC
jgi:hypothetical protein